MENANYEYSTWNWWYPPKIIVLDKFGPKIEMCSIFMTRGMQVIFEFHLIT